MKFSMTTTGRINPSEEIDQQKVEDKLAQIALRRARKFARAMNRGLQQDADRAEQDLAINGELTKSFTDIKEDVGHVQFAARSEPRPQVGGRVSTEVLVSVEPEITPGGRDPEVVARAFEFGSAAWNVPATAFSQRVVQEQQQATRDDLEEVAKVLE